MRNDILENEVENVNNVKMMWSSYSDNCYVTLMSRFWIFLTQNWNWLTLNSWSKTNC